MSELQLTWLDGAPATSLPLPDRGLDFGDGLFETLLVRDGVPLHLEQHIERFRYGCDRLSFPDCGERLAAEITAFCVHLATIPWAALRATVTRGAARRGYAPPVEVKPRILLTANELGRDGFQQMPPAQLVEAEHRLALQPALSQIKHLNRLEQVLIASQVSSAGADDAVVYDREDRLICGGASNIFLVMDGQVHTPGIEAAGILGTRRSLLLQAWLPSIGIESRVRELRRDDLARAKAVFLTNSLVGVRPVGSIGDQFYEDHTVAQNLFAEYVSSCA